MRLPFLSSATLAADIWAYLVLASPLLRRDTITCAKTYEGTLHVVRLVGGHGAWAGQPNQTATLGDDAAMTLTIDPDRVAAAPMRFQFDTCFTQGWNKDGYHYGQVKPVDLADGVLCLTASQHVAPGYSDDDSSGSQTSPRELFVDSCASTNDGGSSLRRQWFSAQYMDDGPDTPHVKLALAGKPNIDPNIDDRPTVVTMDDGESGIKGAVAAQRLQEPAPMSLVLYDVQVA